ncbi:MAG: AraC family transcriptional regulator [Candidatus Binatia bacterium]
MRSRAGPMVSSAAMSGLLEAIERAGGDAGAILRACGLDRSVFSDADAFVGIALYARLLAEAARQTGDDCFGLHFGEHYNPKNIGPLIYVVLNSPILRAGIENVERYLAVHNRGARWCLSFERERVYLRYELKDLPVEELRQYNELAMVVALNTLRLMVGSRWRPVEVQFVHPEPASISEHLRVFGAPVLFGCPAAALVIDRELLERQVPAADPRLYGILKRYLDRVLEEMPSEDDLLALARRSIGELMRDGDPTLARVARNLAMSPRTLERRFDERGVSFKTLMADTRRRFAINYLKDPANTLTEIAFLLGYSEVSAFNRAFKRWTGQSPMAYRRRADK